MRVKAQRRKTRRKIHRKKCEGVGETEYGMIAPGDYMVNVSVTEKASGKINFIIKSDETSAETKTQ